MTASRTQHSSRDEGVTLIELLVVTAMLGLVTVVVASAVIVVVRNEVGISRVTSRSHDTQQLTNYFPSDVQAGPRLRSAFVGPTDPVTGSGCASAGGYNVFGYDVGSRRVAYKLETISASVGEIDRYVCTSSGGAYTTTSVVNLADQIDLSASPAVAVDFDQDGSLVERVTLSYAKVEGAVEEISGSPRLEVGLAPPGPALGDCPSDPLSAAAGFHAFARGDVELRDGVKVLGALAVGGALTFVDPPSATTSVGQDFANSDPAFDPTSVRMYLTSVNWAASSGVLKQKVGDTRVQMSESEYDIDPPPGQVRMFPPGQTSPVIELDNSGIGVVPPGTVIDFDVAFETLISCATLISYLPNTSLCATCDHANLWDHNSTAGAPQPYLGVGDPSGHQVKIEMDPEGDGGPTVVNLDADQLAAIDQITFYGPNRPSASTPLIFNIANGAAGPTVIFDVPQIELQGNYTNEIFWNFFQADTVRIDAALTGDSDETVWGTVFSPEGRVESFEKIWGGVIADEYLQVGKTVNSNRTFEGMIPWL